MTDQNETNLNKINDIKARKKEYNYNYYHNIIKPDPTKYNLFITANNNMDKKAEYRRNYYNKLKNDPERYRKHLDKNIETRKKNNNI